MKKIAKPEKNEFDIDEPFLSDLMPDDGNLLQHLFANFATTKSFVLSLPDQTLDFRYAPEKWTIKEILSHLAEMERIYMYRALCFARQDHTHLPGFDGDRYVLFSGARTRDAADLLDELEALRYSTIKFLDGLPEESMQFRGSMTGGQATVRALAYHIAGHELHHIRIIKERYL